MAKAKKTANATDKHVGRRVRARRLIIGWTQEKLGDALGLTFQQVQKYEKGTNRVGSSRLVQIAQALGAPVAHFFEGLDEQTKPRGTDEINLINDFMATRDGIRLARAFSNLSPATRAPIVELMETLAHDAALRAAANGSGRAAASRLAAVVATDRL
jgi:transcriptional regulator with XRE-family HTH domain